MIPYTQRDPHAVQPHMQKCFDAIKKLRFGTGGTANAHDIYGFEDPGGEYVAFTEPRRAEGPVEEWLTSVEAGMRQALYDNSNAAVKNYPPHGKEAINRDSWLWAYPAQVRSPISIHTYSDCPFQPCMSYTNATLSPLHHHSGYHCSGPDLLDSRSWRSHHGHPKW